MRKVAIEELSGNMISFVTLLWDFNSKSFQFSRSYDESWVEKLYRGVARNLKMDFEFICYTDNKRDFKEPIRQRRIYSGVPTYSDCIQPFELGKPMILVGLDTIITGDITQLAEHCFESDRVALPLDPYKPSRACNGVALSPKGLEYIAWKHNGENDMVWLRRQPHDVIDEIFPGQVLSYKCHVRPNGIGDARIVYFHGEEKPHQLDKSASILEHWV